MRDLQHDSWLEVLEGKASPTDAAGRQAAQLRAYFELQRADVPAADSEQEKRVMNLLRARSAFAVAAPPQAASWLDALRAWWQAPQARNGLAYGAAALLAFAVVAVPQMLPESDPDPAGASMKGPVPMQPSDVRTPGLNPGERIRTARPEQEALRLQLLLSAQGLASELYPQGKDWVLSAQVPADARAGLQPELRARGVVLPADGRLLLRFSAAE